MIGFGMLFAFYTYELTDSLCLDSDKFTKPVDSGKYDSAGNYESLKKADIEMSDKTPRKQEGSKDILMKLTSGSSDPLWSKRSSQETDR